MIGWNPHLVLGSAGGGIAVEISNEPLMTKGEVEEVMSWLAFPLVLAWRRAPRLWSTLTGEILDFTGDEVGLFSLGFATPLFPERDDSEAGFAPNPVLEKVILLLLQSADFMLLSTDGTELGLDPVVELARTPLPNIAEEDVLLI